MMHRTVTDQAIIDAALFPPSATVPRRACMTDAQRAMIRANFTLKIRTALYARFLARQETLHDKPTLGHEYWRLRAG